MQLKAEIATLKQTKFSNNRSNNHNKRKKQKYTFDTNPPKQGEKWTKTKDGKTFHWCKFCSIWTPNPNHRDNTCTKNPANKNKEKENDSTSTQFNFASYETYDSFRPMFQLEHNVSINDAYCLECASDPVEEFELIHPMFQIDDSPHDHAQ